MSMSLMNPMTALGPKTMMMMSKMETAVAVATELQMSKMVPALAMATEPTRMLKMLPALAVATEQKKSKMLPALARELAAARPTVAQKLQERLPLHPLLERRIGLRFPAVVVTYEPSQFPGLAGGNPEGPGIR